MYENTNDTPLDAVLAEVRRRQWHPTRTSDRFMEV